MAETFIEDGALGVNTAGQETVVDPVMPDAGNDFSDTTVDAPDDYSAYASPDPLEQAELERLGAREPSVIDSTLGEEAAIESQMSLEEIQAGVTKAQEEADRIQAEINAKNATDKPVEEKPKEPVDTGELVLINPETGERRVIYNPGANQDLIKSLQDAGFLPEGDDGEATKLSMEEQLQADIDARNEALDLEAAEKTKLLDDYAAAMDARSQRVVASIKERFALRKEQQKLLNRQRSSFLTAAGIRSGRNRFAPEIQSGLLSAEESAGLSRLAQLDSQETQLIQEAENANEDAQFKVLFEKMAQITQVRQEKAVEAQQLFENMMALDNLNIQKAQENRDDQSHSATFLAPTLFAQIEELGEDALKGDIDKLINDSALEFDIPPDFLAGAVEAYRNEQEEQETTPLKTQVIEANGKKILVNTQTGETIMDFGLAKVASADSLGLYPNLSGQDRINALAFAVDKFGKREGPKQVPLILDMMNNGATLDDIDDNVRLSEVSEEFAGAFKNAFGTASVGMAAGASAAAREELDRLLEDGNIQQARQFIWNLAFDRANSATKDRITGREDSVALLSDVKAQMAAYVAAGGEMGLLKGNMEKLQQKILRDTGNKELASIGNQIAIGIQEYRRSVTGAAFSEAEAQEYERIFPDIRNSKQLNAEKIDSLLKIFSRNQRNYFVRNVGGEETYKQIFETGLEAPTTDTPKTTNITLRNPDTGEERTFTGLSEEDLQDAFSQGFETVE